MTIAHDRHPNAGAHVVGLACTADGSRVVSLGRDGQMRVADAGTGAQTAARKHASVLYAGAVAAAGDGSAVAVAGSNVWILDGASLKKLRVLKRPGREPVQGVAFSPCGAFLATTGARSSAFPHTPVRVWEVATGALVREATLDDHAAYPQGRPAAPAGPRRGRAGRAGPRGRRAAR